MPDAMLFYTRVLSIVGDILRIRLPKTQDVPCYGDLAEVRDSDGRSRLAQVVKLDNEEASLQIFAGSKGVSTQAQVRFLGHPPYVTFSENILGRVFAGEGNPIDGGPPLDLDPTIETGGPSATPVRRRLASEMIRTDVPMIETGGPYVTNTKSTPYFQRLQKMGQARYCAPLDSFLPARRPSWPRCRLLKRGLFYGHGNLGLLVHRFDQSRRISHAEWWNVHYRIVLWLGKSRGALQYHGPCKGCS